MWMDTIFISLFLSNNILLHITCHKSCFSCPSGILQSTRYLKIIPTALITLSLGQFRNFGIKQIYKVHCNYSPPMSMYVAPCSWHFVLSLETWSPKAWSGLRGLSRLVEKVWTQLFHQLLHLGNYLQVFWISFNKQIISIFYIAGCEKFPCSPAVLKSYT